MEHFKYLQFVTKNLRDGTCFSSQTGISYGFFDVRELLDVVEASIIDGADPNQFLEQMSKAEDCHSLEELIIMCGRTEVLDQEEAMSLFSQIFLS